MNELSGEFEARRLGEKPREGPARGEGCGGVAGPGQGIMLGRSAGGTGEKWCGATF
jgi:hypothetical protein